METEITPVFGGYTAFYLGFKTTKDRENCAKGNNHEVNLELKRLILRPDQVSKFKSFLEELGNKLPIEIELIQGGWLTQ